MKRKKIAVVFGTRPDAIKMAPLILEAPHFPELEIIPISSGQHREMLTPVLNLFGITPQYDAEVFHAGQSLDTLTAKIIEGVGRIYDECTPDVVLVHGDTTTGFASALAAFYRKIPVGHVEAGLRTNTLLNPFPEEMNRRCIDQICTYHFAPTEAARKNLEEEGFTDAIVTGNTVVDALTWTRQRTPALPSELQDIDPTKKVILLTSHRRENIGNGMTHIFQAVREIAATHPEVEVIFPIHLNNAVREIAQRELDKSSNVRIIEPVDYSSMVALLDRATLILTDSGGLQEEAPAFAKPVLVLRETTERPEVMEAGCGKLVGTDRELIMREANLLLSDKTAYQAMATAANPYGEPGVAKRILTHMLNV